MTKPAVALNSFVLQKLRITFLWGQRSAKLEVTFTIHRYQTYLYMLDFIFFISRKPPPAWCLKGLAAQAVARFVGVAGIEELPLPKVLVRVGGLVLQFVCYRS